MREAEIGSSQYAQIINSSRLIENIVREGLEGMRESIEEMGLELKAYNNPISASSPVTLRKLVRNGDV